MYNSCILQHRIMRENIFLFLIIYFMFLPAIYYLIIKFHLDRRIFVVRQKKKNKSQSANKYV